MLTKIKNGYNKLIDAVCIADMILMIIIVFYQVVARKVFSSSPIWTGELSRFLMVWAIFLGSSIAFRKREHLGVDYFVGLIPLRLQRILSVVVDIVLLIVLLYIAYYGWQLCAFVKQQVSPALRISMSLPYLAVPLGCLTMSIEIIWHLAFSYGKEVATLEGGEQ